MFVLLLKDERNQNGIIKIISCPIKRRALFLIAKNVIKKQNYSSFMSILSKLTKKCIEIIGR